MSANSERVEITPELLNTVSELARAVPFGAWDVVEDEDAKWCVIAPEPKAEPWLILNATKNVHGDEDGETAARYVAACPSVVLSLVERIRELESERAAMRRHSDGQESALRAAAAHIYATETEGRK